MPAQVFAHQGADTFQGVALDPVHCEPVGCHEPQRVAALHGLQRPQPHVDLLLLKVVLKLGQNRGP